MNNYSDPDKVLTQEDWLDSWNVQNACNLSGVTYSFAKVIQKVREEASARREGWDWADRHPLVQLYVDKITSLAHFSRTEVYQEMYSILKEKLGGEFPCY